MSVIESLKNKEECLWLNPDLEALPPQFKWEGYGFVYMKAAQNRFMRFLPYIAKAFPETAARKGVIESNLLEIGRMKEYLNQNGSNIQGRVFLKDDAHLPIAGSVKARGGIHEVLSIAENLARKEGKLLPTDSYEVLDSDDFRSFFSQYTIQVGSTGNLGVSIGRTAAKLGFQVIVHMSRDAKQWKKDLLRSEGVLVKEYSGDYGQAVARGREESEADEKSFFVDDENSRDLFFGYSSAGMRLSVQLRKLGIPVNKSHPLFVYIPCGVGGAPGGITFGLKQMFGEHVHCFFAEPLDAPCLTYAMAEEQDHPANISEIGLDCKTIADGLAVGRASEFVCKMMKPMLSGSYTLKDSRLLEYQKKLFELEDIFLEPSACAGFHGLEEIGKGGNQWETYLTDHQLIENMNQATHVVWGTGGGLMPENERWR